MKGFGAFLWGIPLVLAAVALLWWNEGRAVNTARALADGASSVTTVAAEQAASAAEGSLIHLSAEATVVTQFVDAELGLRREALRWRRTVEMYQWRRTSSQDDGNPVYRQEWSSQRIDSSDYPAERQNPASFPLLAGELVAQDARIGGLALTPQLITRSSDLQPLDLSPWERTLLEARLDLQGITVAPGSTTADGGLHLPYGGGTADAPAVGDLRLRLTWLPAGQVSVVGRKAGAALEPYATSSGFVIGFLRPGHHSAEALFERAEQQNRTTTIAMRVIGALLMAFGFRTLFSPIATLTGWIPLLGGLTRAGLNLLAGSLALVISVATASTAWLVYRPLVAVPLLLLTVAAAYLLLRRRPSATPATQAAAPST